MPRPSSDPDRVNFTVGTGRLADYDANAVGNALRGVPIRPTPSVAFRRRAGLVWHVPTRATGTPRRALPTGPVPVSRREPMMLAGVARTRISPPWGVELSGWGYYLNRIWTRSRDHTGATALVLDDGTRAIAVIAVDLMYADAAFDKTVRDMISRHTSIVPEAICVSCSHSHNT